MKHLNNCEEQAQKRSKEIKAWETKWPNHCTKCNGVGGFEYTENQSPLGSGLVWNEHLFETCEVCLGNEKCPRCGGEFTEAMYDKEEPCKVCGWNWDKNPEDSIPAPYECYCWEEEKAWA